MKKLICISAVTMLLLFAVCKPAVKEYQDIGTIDLTYSDGWNTALSIKIDSTGNFLLQRYYPQHSTCHTGRAPDSLLIEIDSLVREINLIHPDTAYEGNCVDCESFRINIKSKEFDHMVFSHGRNGPESLVRLANELFLFGRKMPGRKVDTTYSFKTTPLLPPPPVIETIKFIPPPTE